MRGKLPRAKRVAEPVAAAPMKTRLLSMAFLLAIAAPVVQASVISIDDLAESLQLRIDLPLAITPPGGTAGAGNLIDLTQGSDAANQLSAVTYDPAREFLSFTFADHVPWNTDFFSYRYFTEPTGGISDLFVIQGLGGQEPDYITFISNDLLTGNLTSDIAQFGIVLVGNGVPSDLGPITENGGWQLAFDTGVDQYFVRSDIPEPATFALLGLGLAGLGFSYRKRSD